MRDFYESTPYELNLAKQGYVKRKEREAEEYLNKYENERKLLTVQAYLISRWVWQKEVNIDKALGESQHNKSEMTDEEIYQELLKLANR